MKIFAIYECEISGGTDRLLIHLIKNWGNKESSWTVLCHSKNSGFKLIKDELQGYADVKTYSVGDLENNISKMFAKKGISKWKKMIGKFFLISACFRQLLFFRHLFKENRPDLIYLHQGGYPGGFSEHMAGIATKTLSPKIKVVMSIQNLPAMRDKRLFSKVMDWIVNHYADSLIFASKYTMAEYLNKTRLDNSIMHIIPEGVSANIEGKTLQNPTDKINIGIIGSYEPRKGHRVLFDAIGLLKDKDIPDVMIHCYGQSMYGEHEKLAAYTKKLGIHDLILWHEYERDFDKLYGHLDIVVQASVDGESMPLVAIDAAAYYKPVIASKLQGLMEIVEHNVTGYLFDIGDSHALSTHLEELIVDPKKRQDMGEPARKRYEERFTAARMSHAYYNVFIK